MNDGTADAIYAIRTRRYVLCAIYTPRPAHRVVLVRIQNTTLKAHTTAGLLTEWLAVFGHKANDYFLTKTEGALPKQGFTMGSVLLVHPFTVRDHQNA